jgi:hypothetical protein
MSVVAVKPAVNGGTKAETLQRLREAYPDIGVPPLFFFTVARWRASEAAVLAEIKARLKEPLAVRSSALTEDAQTHSNAGAYLSVLGVRESGRGEIEKAVTAVIRSMPGDDRNQILVQEQILDVEISGVVMTRCLDDGAPYYVLNYDDESGATDRVTGGQGVSKTVHIFRGARLGDLRSARIRKIMALVRRLEAIFSSDALDVEFGLDHGGRLYLFQARPIALQRKWDRQAEGLVRRNFGRIEEFFQFQARSRPDLFGGRAIFGVMPDWNPAEMIGVLPRPLAVSLYRELITRNAWRLARERMGYRPVSGELMVVAAGRPYIDVRRSFNSFLPAGLKGSTCRRIIDAWTRRLSEHPELHDKVEFGIASTCLDFTFSQTWPDRYPGLLKPAEFETYRGALQSLTLANLKPLGSLAEAEKEIARLEGLQKKRPAAAKGGEHLFRLSHLIEETVKYGTTPFAVLARHAFIAESLLRSAVARGAFEARRLAAWRGGIRTVVDSLTNDLAAASRDEKLRPEFLAKYGHLRPSSYDILSPRYADRRNIFASSGHSASFRPRSCPSERALAPVERRGLARLLKEAGLGAVSPEDMLGHAERAIAGREYAKFVFTRNLSEILETIADFGAGLGFGRDDLSYLALGDILETTVVSPLESMKERLGRNIASNRELFRLAQALRLPYLITSHHDVKIVPQHRGAPNFIGFKSVTAPVVRLSAAEEDADLAGRLVCIENADPGFDWIFGRGLAGLITKFGGANSHMAVRCAEYGLPAATGCGEKLFEEISRAAEAELNPHEKILRPTGRGL